MKTITIIKNLFILALIFIMSTTTVLASDTASEGKIAVNGTYSVSVEPDYAKITIGVVSNATSVKEAQEDCNKKMNALLEDLKKNKIDEKDIRTQSYDVSPIYEYESSLLSTQKIKSYDVSYNIEITVNDINSTGKIIDICIHNGANNAYGIEFLSSKVNEAYNQALIGALKNAREKVELLSKESGTTISGVILVNEERNYSSYGQGIYKSYDASAMQESQTNIAVGSLDITANVNMEFSIK